MHQKDWFITFYFNFLRNTPLFQEMQKVFENSPWHREENVLTHTDMVVSQFISNNNNIHPKAWLLGALSCAFHDVGKPSSIQYKNSPERGDYKSFGGHELISARLWEDFAVTNWNLFKEYLLPSDICNIAWLIEHHLPYKLKKEHKLSALFANNSMRTDNVLQSILRADCWGRISDDHEMKKDDVEKWIFSFMNDSENIKFTQALYANSTNTRPSLYILIGASGCGKSTYTKQLHIENIYSLDSLRLQWYGDNYKESFDMSISDNTFTSRAQKNFKDMLTYGKDIVVDNTNVSTKRRKFYIDAASNKGYKTVAVVFPTSLQNVLDRQHTRGDKNVPSSAVISQYMSTQQPSIGEVDDIIVCDKNIV